MPTHTEAQGHTPDPREVLTRACSIIAGGFDQDPDEYDRAAADAMIAILNHAGFCLVPVALVREAADMVESAANRDDCYGFNRSRNRMDEVVDALRSCCPEEESK
jgi:hypothetical protein